jgi:endonuclease/exonuclease/phosphatase family metal-dependent hydrolase
MTYNLNWAGGNRPVASLDLIKESAPDVVALQETHPQWEMLLRQHLGELYPHMLFHDGGRRRGGGKALLSRYPLTDIKPIPSTTGWFDGLLAVTETPLGRIQILNVHLRPPAGDDGRFSFWVLASAGEHHVAELNRFTQTLDPELPAIVLGDFNEKPGGRGCKNLKTSGYTNALHQFDRKTPTWTYQAGAIRLARQMDHIFYSSQLHCFSARVLRGGSSDHHPVVAVVGESDVREKQ